MNSPVLSEAHRLWVLGFAILWIKPRDKRPVQSKWTTGPRESWETLKRTYKPGYNLGVRTGEASKIGTKYLACIDIDVKAPSFEPKARARLSELLGKTACPSVASGSGGASRHLYCLTDKPFKMITLLKEKDGEICVYSNGRQMVLPPSIHPSGKAYKWERDLLKTELPILKFETKEEESNTLDLAPVEDWKPEPVDIITSYLDDSIVKLIVDADCDDGSKGIYKAAIALVKHGFTQRQIETILTDKDYELGCVAYRHTQSPSRLRAAKWIREHTLKKVYRETDATKDFETEVEVASLSDEAAQTQAAEIVVTDWKNLLDKTQKGKLNATLNNALLILKNTIGPSLFKRDIFALKDKYGQDTEWGGKKDTDIKDADILKIKVWFIQKFKVELRNTTIEDAVGFISLENAYHPVRDYLEALEWDGKPRLDNWLRTYLGADGPEPYLSAVARKTLCAMVARIYVPGIKFDHVLIMNGKQGIGKSSAAQILASPKWFMDRLPDLRDKDSMINLQGIWVVEMGELANMRSSSVETYKAFLSSQVDKFRLPYGQRREDFERQCVIVGSSNPNEFLNDPTGNRRFWPVQVRQCDFAALARDRDQLLAEAKWTWQNLEEPLYLKPEEEAQALVVQAGHMHDTEDDYLEDIWDNHQIEHQKGGENGGLDRLKLEALFDVGGAFQSLVFARDARKVARVLKKKGYMRKRDRTGKKYWVRKNGSLEVHQKQYDT